MFSNALKQSGQTHHFQSNTAEKIFLVTGLDILGEAVWHYVLVEKHKHNSFKNKHGADMLKLKDYGQVLFSGFGEQPPEAVQRYIQEEYDFIA